MEADTDKNTTGPELRNMATGKTAASRLTEVAPGQWVCENVDPADVPRWGFVRLMRQVDGSYLPVIKVHGAYVRMSADLADQVGLPGLSVMTMRRLLRAGFVECSRPAPDTVMVDLASLAAHVEAARDSEFWTPARRKRWRDACAEVRPK